jgi:hypothetical protein
MDIVRPRRTSRSALVTPIVVVALLAAAGCAPKNFNTSAHADTSYDFDAVETYALRPERAKVANNPNSEFVAAGLRAGLNERGYREVSPDEADVLVSWDIGVHAAARVSGNTTMAKREGGLTLWVRDRKTGHQVWYGWAERYLSEQDEPEATIRAAIEAIFEDQLPHAD